MKHTKLFLLLCSFFFAFILFKQGFFDAFEHAFRGHGYLSIFFSGLFFSSSFTTPFAIALFVEMSPDVHPLLAAPIGGFGALLADLTLFRFIRTSFGSELHDLQRARFLRWIHRILHRHSFLERIRPVLLWSVAGFIIASPLPDELGISLLSSNTNVASKRFMMFCFLLNTAGIFFILAGARALI